MAAVASRVDWPPDPDSRDFRRLPVALAQAEPVGAVLVAQVAARRRALVGVANREDLRRSVVAVKERLERGTTA